MPRLGKLMTEADVHGQDVAREIHARRAVKLRHQQRRFGQLHAADNAIEPFAAADSADERTELDVGMPAAERFRDLKRDLKPSALFGQAAPHGGLRRD